MTIEQAKTILESRDVSTSLKRDLYLKAIQVAAGSAFGAPKNIVAPEPVQGE